MVSRVVIAQSTGTESSHRLTDSSIESSYKQRLTIIDHNIKDGQFVNKQRDNRIKAWLLLRELVISNLNKPKTGILNEFVLQAVSSPLGFPLIDLVGDCLKVRWQRRGW